MACTNCGKCGRGRSGLTAAERADDPVKAALCTIMCQMETEICEDPSKRRTRDAEMRRRAQNSPDVADAVNRKHPGKGATQAYNRRRYIPYKNPPPGNWGRSPLTGEALERFKNRMRRQIEQASRRALSDAAKRKLRRAWLKFIPVVNAISTAVDLYELGSMGVDLYRALDALNDPVFTTRPDLVLDSADGQMLDIYDFKFSGDEWQPGQKELYDAAAQQAGVGEEAGVISPETCKCDVPPGGRPARGMS